MAKCLCFQSEFPITFDNAVGTLNFSKSQSNWARSKKKKKTSFHNLYNGFLHQLKT